MVKIHAIQPSPTGKHSSKNKANTLLFKYYISDFCKQKALTYNFIWPTPPLNDPYKGLDLLKLYMSVISHDCGGGAFCTIVWYSAVWRPPYTCMLRTFFCGALTFTWSLKKSVNSSFLTSLSAATYNHKTLSSQITHGDKIKEYIPLLLFYQIWGFLQQSLPRRKLIPRVDFCVSPVSYQ